MVLTDCYPMVAGLVLPVHFRRRWESSRVEGPVTGLDIAAGGWKIVDGLPADGSIRYVRDFQAGL